MGAFNNAWTLLKNRGFEVDPRGNKSGYYSDHPIYEDERMQRLEEGYDERDRLTDNLRDANARMERRGAFADGNDYDERDNLENELYQLMRNPEGAHYGDPPMNMIEAQTGPMFQEQQRQEAEGIEAEGIDLPHGPRVSAVPPADIGRAGSLTPEPHPELDFNPFTFHENNRLAEELYLDEKRNPYGHGGLKEYSESLEQTPLGQALTQARSQPPQPLQFEKAWSVLKSRTNRDYPFTPSGPAGKQTQYSPMFTGNTIPLVGEGVNRTQTDESRHGGRPISSGTRRAREKVNMQQMMRDESAPNLEEEE